MHTGPQPRDEGVGEKIKRAWRATERYGPFVLVGLAFLLQTVGLALDQPLATAMAGILLSLGLLLIFALVFEIHSHLFQPPKERTYLEFDQIVPEIRERLELAAKQQNKMEIKVIGLTLKNQWKVIEDFLRKLGSSSTDVRVDIHIVHLDQEWEELEEINPRMPIMVRALKRSIEDFSEDFASAFADEGHWSLELYGIREFPIVAGILIDRDKLYRTLCDADRGKIIQGQQLYEYFEYGKPRKPFDQQTVDHFERIFEYYVSRSTTGSLSSASQTPPTQTMNPIPK